MLSDDHGIIPVFVFKDVRYLGLDCALGGWAFDVGKGTVLDLACYNAAALAQDVQSPETDFRMTLLWQTTQVRTGITGLTSKP